MSDLWKRKLAAYLHDPPSKALDIKTHGERSDAPISGDSALWQRFVAVAKTLAGTGDENDPRRKVAKTALEQFEKHLPEAQLQAVVGLCQTVAFANRTSSDSKSSVSPAPSLAPTLQAERQPA